MYGFKITTLHLNTYIKFYVFIFFIFPQFQTHKCCNWIGSICSSSLWSSHVNILSNCLLQIFWIRIFRIMWSISCFHEFSWYELLVQICSYISFHSMDKDVFFLSSVLAKNTNVFNRYTSFKSPTFVHHVKLVSKIKDISLSSLNCSKFLLVRILPRCNFKILLCAKAMPQSWHFYSLKGPSSKPSGNCIVVPNLCFLS